jgi:MFS family permease
MEKSNRRFAWKMLLCSCLLIGGGQGILVSCAGIFIQPVCQANGFGVGPFSTYLSIGAVAMMVGFPLAGKVMAKFPLRPLLIACILVNCGMFMLYSQFTQLWMFYVAVIFTGLSCVIPAYMTGPLLISNWFEKKRGLAMGIAMSCTGIFGAIFSIVGGQLIASAGYKQAYIILGLVALLMMLVASFMAVMHPSMKGMVAYGAESAAAASEAGSPAAGADGVSQKAAIKSPSFLIMFVIIFFVVCAGAFSSQVSVLAVNMGFDIATASSFAAIFMVGCLLGSFILGWLNDKIGVRNTTLLILLLGAGSISLVIFGGTTSAMFVLGILLFGVAASAGGVQPPIIVGNLFGHKDYASIYGTMQIALSLGGVVASPVYGFVLDATGSYAPALLVVAAVLLVSIPLTLVAFKAKDKLWAKESAAA